MCVCVSVYVYVCVCMCGVCACVCVSPIDFAIHQRLTRHCKSTIFRFLKRKRIMLYT